MTTFTVIGVHFDGGKCNEKWLLVTTKRDKAIELARNESRKYEETFIEHKRDNTYKVLKTFRNGHEMIIAEMDCNDRQEAENICNDLVQKIVACENKDGCENSRAGYAGILRSYIAVLSANIKYSCACGELFVFQKNTKCINCLDRELTANEKV